MKSEIYYFHQTPNDIATKLLNKVNHYFTEGDSILEPFKGEGSFYNNFRSDLVKEFCEIEEDIDYKTNIKNHDWVVSNPPFRLEINGKRVNSIFDIICFYSTKVNKGLMFLLSLDGLNTLTSKRIKYLEDNCNLYINQIIVCDIKKWRNRYYFIVMTKHKSDNFTYL